MKLDGKREQLTPRRRSNGARPPWSDEPDDGAENAIGRVRVAPMQT